MQSPCVVGGPKGSIRIGRGEPLTIIAGPCVLESEALGLQVARALAPVCERLGLRYIFKASFDKANRSSIASPRGPGLAQGLAWLASIRRVMGLPVTTDLHEPGQASDVAGVVDLLQIPAFLCRQTDLVEATGRAAAAKGRAVNIKKGQFLSPLEMVGPLRKLAEAGCANILATERGTTFGYGRLVNDFLGMGDLMELHVPASKTSPARPPVPLCFDATHSTQLPGGGEQPGVQTGGRPDRAGLLARAAVAAGCDAVFIECHPAPKSAMSDASTMLTIEQATALLGQLARVRAAVSD
jgi:2-dehydro-3-deoxyphosphooctonate aldolase (KDO 8-P synthase)